MEEELGGRLLIPKYSGGKNGGAATNIVFLSTFVTVCGSFAMGCANGFSSPAASGIMEELGLSIAEYSTFGSMVTIGGMLGSVLSGKVADLIGRKYTMWVLEAFFITGWLAIVFATGPWWLDLGRLLLGFACGIQAYVASVYIAEITPKNIRGGLTIIIQLMVCCGVSLMFVAGNVISWRTLALIGVIPCILQFFGLFLIPESPRWLAKIGREKEFESTLRRLRGENVDIFEEVTEINDSMKSFQYLPKTGIFDLFERKYTRSLIAGIGIMFLVPMGGGPGVVFYASSIFEAAGGSSYLGTTAMAVIQIPFSVLGIVLMDRFGGRLLLMVSLLGTCFGSVLAGLAFIFRDIYQLKELTSPILLAGILVYFASFAMGVAGTPWVIMAEVFPMNIKGSAGSLGALFTNISSWIVSYAFGFLLDWSPTGVFFIFAIISGSTIIFVAKFVPETRGRTLEEIQASMTHASSQD